MKNDITESTTPIGVKQVPTSFLHPNPHNPRVLFDREPLNTLEDSIRRNGILVPLTVYKESRTGHYVILDGQRRWMCAQNIKLSTVPVNEVAEPTLVQNIVTMFQIHKLREDWELMPTALKVSLLMDELKERNEKRLAQLTGLDEAVIVRCKKLISYDAKFQDMMLEPDPKKRIKADFFIELYVVINDRDVKRFSWFAKTRFIEQMLDKYLGEYKTIRSVTDFRIMKQYVTNARNAQALNKFSMRLKEFAENTKLPISHLEIDEANVSAEARALLKKLDSLYNSVIEMDAAKFYGDEDLWKAISKLVELLEKKLSEADKRRTS